MIKEDMLNCQGFSRGWLFETQVGDDGVVTEGGYLEIGDAPMMVLSNLQICSLHIYNESGAIFQKKTCDATRQA